MQDEGPGISIQFLILPSFLRVHCLSAPPREAFIFRLVSLFPVFEFGEAVAEILVIGVEFESLRDRRQG